MTMVLLFSKMAVNAIFAASLRFLKSMIGERLDPSMAVEKVILTIGLMEMLLKGGDVAPFIAIAVSLKAVFTGICSFPFLQEKQRRIKVKKQRCILFMGVSLKKKAGGCPAVFQK